MIKPRNEYISKSPVKLALPIKVITWIHTIIDVIVVSSMTKENQHRAVVSLQGRQWDHKYQNWGISIIL